jgi:flagellar biosynthesis protein FlhG
MERELNDQAYNLRKSAWKREHKAIYLSVSSGKGGVGKTTFAINLACLLAAAGKRTLVFDADLGLGNIDIMLKITPKANIQRYLEGKAAINDVLIKNVCGFDLFPASSGVMELTDLSEDNFLKLQDILINLDSMYDYVIFDTGAGISNTVQLFASLADSVIIVSQTEPSAIADAYAFVKTAVQKHNLKRAFLVFNKVENPMVALKVYQNLKEVVQKFLGVDLVSLGSLSDDPDARKAQRSQKPLCMVHPNSPFVEEIKNIVLFADRIWAK